MKEQLIKIREQEITNKCKLMAIQEISQCREVLCDTIDNLEVLIQLSIKTINKLTEIIDNLD